MILLRQKTFATSVYASQTGFDGPMGKDFHIQDGEFKRTNQITKEGRDLILRKRKYKTTKSGGKICAGKDGLHISFHEGLSSGGRKISQEFHSTKDPVSAYRDFLRMNNQRMQQGDVFGESVRSISNKEIKDAIRKNAKKQAILKNVKKAAPWVIGGTAIAGATAAGIKIARKNKKKDKKDNK